MTHFSKILLLLLGSYQVMANTPVRYIDRESNLVVISVEGHPDLLVRTPDTTYVNIYNLDKTNGGLSFSKNDNFLPQALLDGYKLDVWEDGPISFPYASLLCDNNGYYKQGCSGFSTRARPAQIDAKGFYGLSDRISRVGGLSSRLSQSALWYLRDMPVGTSIVRDLHYCIYQDTNNSNRCTAQPGSVDWRVRKLTTNKVGHIKFVSKDINEEIVIDSNGNPTPAPGGSGACIADRVGNSNGLTCTIASYNLSWVGVPNSPLEQYFFSGVLKERLYSSDELIAFKFGQQIWSILYPGSETIVNSLRINNQRGTEQIKVFFNNALLKRMYKQNKVHFDDIAELYATYQTGYLYGLSIPFRGGFEFIPRAQTVSIKSADGNPSPYQTGEVGKDNLVFNYELSETGYTNAARLEVKVTQDVGIPHQGRCTFYPDGQIESSRAVPVPTSIIFSSVGNQPVSTPIECNGPPIDLRSRKIIESRPAQEWDEGGIGYTRFYDLGLQFSLTDNMTRKTVSGDDWEGLVHQSGKVILTGLWN
ncbi:MULTISPECIES: hypothetical protein [unclassified Aeromonas]|uniref:hypothetical protein n=1 Tax=unclassified Aeromonas TaxID=257493 RepID=UPI003BA1661B